MHQFLKNGKRFAVRRRSLQCRRTSGPSSTREPEVPTRIGASAPGACVDTGPPPIRGETSHMSSLIRLSHNKASTKTEQTNDPLGSGQQNGPQLKVHMAKTHEHSLHLRRSALCVGKGSPSVSPVTESYPRKRGCVLREDKQSLRESCILSHITNNSTFAESLSW